MIKRLIKEIGRTIIRRFKNQIRGIADECDIALLYARKPYGPNVLSFDGGIEDYGQRVPKTVLFNTGSGKIHIGAETAFGDNVMVLTGMHMDVEESSAKGLPLHTPPREGRDIDIGKGCFIGSGAIIVGPCRIGDFCVVSAGAVVSGDVAPYTLVAGVPARAIKRFKVDGHGGENAKI